MSRSYLGVFVLSLLFDAFYNERGSIDLSMHCYLSLVKIKRANLYPKRNKIQRPKEASPIISPSSHKEEAILQGAATTAAKLDVGTSHVPGLDRQCFISGVRSSFYWLQDDVN